VEGELLTDVVAGQPGKRLRPFEALHLIHAIARGLEVIHTLGEYHGDVHSDNVLVRRRGIHFVVKIIDFFHWGPARAANIREDVIQLVRLLYDAVGGAARYAGQPPEIKAICRGLRRDLIAKKFSTAGRLREHLESFDWS
jgi:tRNA A-37 threonylcarbamoyl transferase component Bud32